MRNKWSKRLNIKNLLTEGETLEEVQGIGKSIASIIKICIKNDEELISAFEEVIEHLQNITTPDEEYTPVEEFNMALEEVYNLCDYYDIWVY